MVPRQDEKKRKNTRVGKGDQYVGHRVKSQRDADGPE